MLVKTAVKKALKPFAAEAEGLAMMYAEDETGGPQASDDTEYPAPPRNVTDRAGGVLDSAMGAMAADMDATPEPDPEPDQGSEAPAKGFDAPEGEPAAEPADGDQDLF